MTHDLEFYFLTTREVSCANNTSFGGALVNINAPKTGKLQLVTFACFIFLRLVGRLLFCCCIVHQSRIQRFSQVKFLKTTFMQLSFINCQDEIDNVLFCRLLIQRETCTHLHYTRYFLLVFFSTMCFVNE